MAYKIPNSRPKEKEEIKIDNEKIDYFKINGNEMMREDFNAFLEYLKSKNDEVNMYSSDGKNIILEVKRKKAYSGIDLEKEDNYQKGLGSWIYYHPIDFLTKKPKFSDYDKIENGI